jgi:selenobiotic family peptide radical SAM maturase
MACSPPQDREKVMGVKTSNEKTLEMSYPVCRSLMGAEAWERAAAGLRNNPEAFPERIKSLTGTLGLPEYLPELARLEWAYNSIKDSAGDIPEEVEGICINPSVRLLELSWRNLIPLLIKEEQSSLKPEKGPEKGDELVLLWQDPKTGETRAEVPSGEDLIALKILSEGISPEEAARAGGLPVGVVDAAVDTAVHRGIVLSPGTRIRRDPETFPTGEITDESFFSSSVFTLQWHITQSCDLHCKHCYDRSDRSPMGLDQALRILDDLRSFCRSRFVRGQVSFSGGNPLLYPHFNELYRAALERGLEVAIIGNPAPRKRIEEILEIRKPAFYQVSLEGLQEHNDAIRGPGHFGRTMEFLGVLRDLGVYSMVMLTLTRDNMDDVLPLAEMLRDSVDSFTFNRLSMVGEGANLHLPEKKAFRAFLDKYMEAAGRNPIIGLKDNLLNILRLRKGMEPFGGCTGYGCGAAFNFLAVLSDGEAHACRKFPSPIGNVFRQGLEEIYDSPMARRYRGGCEACRRCAIRPVCGGCLSMAHSYGLDVFEERDPFCFIDDDGSN